MMMEQPHPDSSDNELGSCSKSVHATTHELQDLLMSSDGEGMGPAFPPPRIAARFYRSGNSRRKSSAASSRRNSITSHHSSRSARSAHGGPQSTHIAQHLRRASILENRKARLADKAAHAEKVRLRAAMVKAAPRMSTTSELRAAAAEQARNRHLAQVAAQCAEEVQRAKKKAEDTREKKAAEHLKLKGHMEERLAEAERRRILYQQGQRRTRTASLARVMEEKKAVPSRWPPKTVDEAATLIQKAWRNRTKRRIVQDFLELGLTVEHIRLIPFEDVGVLISSEKVLARTAKLLKFCGLQDGDGGGIGERTAVRSFLSAFLILGHPDYVMDVKGVQEQDVIDQAERLLSSFERILARSPTTAQFAPLASQLATLADAYASFQAAFAAWKDHDSSVLVQTMLAQFVELDAMWQVVKNDAEGGVAEDYRVGIETHQAQILVRLKRLAGPEKAIKMISEAVRASRRAKTKPKKKRTGDVRPRAVASESNSSLTDEKPGISQPPPAESATSDISESSGHLGRVVNLTSIPDNRTMIHELAINKEYRIDITSRTDARDAIIQAVYNSIQVNLQARPGDAWWIVTLVEILRGKLLGLVRPGSSLHTLILETLDMKMLMEQVSDGLFSFERFFSFMITILPKLCAPARDAEVEAFARDPSEDPVERLAKLHYVVDLLSLDNANHMIQRNARMLITQAAAYEQGCFARIFGDDGPHKTQEWWSSAKVRALEAISRRSPESGTSSSSNGLTAERIYSQGLVDLAIAVPTLKDTDLPETLELDRERISRIRSDTLRIVTLGSVLLTAKNLLKRDVRTQWKAEAQRMWDLPYAHSQTFLWVIESGHTMSASSKSQLSGTIERILSDARDKLITHPVMRVLFRKLKTHMMSRLWASSSEDRVKAITGATETLGSGGLAEFVSQVNLMADELARMREVDRAAHGKWYDAISTMAMSDVAEAETEAEPEAEVETEAKPEIEAL